MRQRFKQARPGLVTRDAWSWTLLDPGTFSFAWANRWYSFPLPTQKGAFELTEFIEAHLGRILNEVSRTLEGFSEYINHA